jgi:hypothetical protein
MICLQATPRFERACHRAVKFPTLFQSHSFADLDEPVAKSYDGSGLNSFRGSSMTEPTYEELKARLATLEKQQEKRRAGSMEFRVGEKGGVSVYGLGRFPVTLYYEQWIRLLDAADKLREFLEENKSKLKLKDQ